MEQYIGDGANLFINIVVALMAFGAALNLLNFLKTKKEEAEEN